MEFDLMKKKLLLGAIVACFASPNIYAATCTDSGTDGYTDDCDATMRLDLTTYAVIQFPAAGGNGGSDLNVVWDGSTAGNSTDSINICIGTNGTTDVDVTATSANATAWNVNDGTTDVPYTLTLDGNDLTDGAEVIANADATDLACTVSDIPLELGFSNATLATTPTDGTTPFTDVVTITVAPQ